jgi:hypothetical protein
MSIPTEKDPLPNWAKHPFQQFLAHQKRVGHLVMLSQMGISMLPHRPLAIEVLARSENPEMRPDEGQLEEARNLAKLADEEMRGGFQLLYAQATISLWASLEYLFHDFFATWLQKVPAACSSEPVKSIKINLADYESMSPDERYSYLVDLLERDLKSPLRQGIARFESVLEVFGLGGAVDENLRKSLFELYHVRNVLAHRGGICDRRLKQACPWLPVTQGKAVVVTAQTFNEYMISVEVYALTVVSRLLEHFESANQEDVIC